MKRVLLVLAVAAALLTAIVFVMYATNVAPAVRRISDEEARRADKPYVVKVHAQWCAVCMVTKDVWSEIEHAYAGRVHLLVLDFTNDEKTQSSRAEASRLGLQTLFDEYSGATGTIVVLDGRTKEVAAEISGSRDFAEYRAAIDSALNRGAAR